MPNTLIPLDEASLRLEKSKISGRIFAELLVRSEPLLFGLFPGNELHDPVNLSRVTSFRAEPENVVVALNLAGVNSVPRLSGGDAGSLGVGFQTSRLIWRSELAIRDHRCIQCGLPRRFRSRRGELGRNGLRMRYSPAPYPRRGNHREGNAALNRGSARTQRPPSTKISRIKCSRSMS